MAALDGDVLIHKYELFNDMAVALAELQAGIRDRMTPKDILEMILEAETVAPVKHGRWNYGEDETIEDGGWCSVCHCDQPTFWVDKAWRYVETRYCPHCGALMDEEG